MKFDKRLVIVTVVLMTLFSVPASAQSDNSFNATFEAYYNGTGQGPSFELGNVMPGDRGRWGVTIETKNNSNVYVKLEKTLDEENDCIEPETDFENCDPDGELDENLDFYAWRDSDGDGTPDGNEEEIQLVDQWTPIQRKGLIEVFEGGKTHNIGVRWELPYESTTSDVQTDSVRYDLKLQYNSPPRETGDETAPTISFSYTPSNPDENDNIVFEATATDNVGISKYEWDWDGDGNFDETGRTASNRFSPGTYDVTLRVTDTSGNEATTTQSVQVDPAGGSDGGGDGGDEGSDGSGDGSSGDGNGGGDSTGSTSTGSGGFSTAGSSSTGNTGGIRFTVTDDGGSPLENVKITAEPTGKEETTDSSGEATFYLQEDSYEFTLERSGYQEIQVTEQVEANQLKKVSVTMQESEGSNDYLLIVDVEDENGNNLADANVQINGSLAQGRTNDNGRYSQILPENYYAIEVSKDGYDTAESPVQLDSDKTVDIELESISSPAPDQNGNQTGDAAETPAGSFLAQPGTVTGIFLLILILLLSVGVYRYYVGPWLAGR